MLVNDYFAERAEAAADAIRAAGGAAGALPFDVTDHAAVHDAITGAGGVDILVNNAGNAGTEGFGTPDSASSTPTPTSGRSTWA